MHMSMSKANDIIPLCVGVLHCSDVSARRTLVPSSACTQKNTSIISTPDRHMPASPVTRCQHVQPRSDRGADACETHPARLHLTPGVGCDVDSSDQTPKRA